jgi:diphosphomevalonate decarboxylase
VENILPERLDKLRKAIDCRDFGELCEITMKDSNNFHAVCRDTYPPISYLNDTSNVIIKCIEKINEIAGEYIVIY